MYSPSQEVGQENASPEDYETLPECPICGEARQSLLFWGEDDRYGYPGTFPVAQCSTCNFAYLAKRPHVAQIPDLYQQYYPTVVPAPAQVSGWQTALKRSPFITFYCWLANIRDNLYTCIRVRPGMRVLCVGSGPEALNAQRVIQKGGEWLAVDVDEKKCRALEKAGLKTFCGNLETFQATNSPPFDYIVLSQVLEHIYYPRQFLSSCRSLLKPGGKIILCCPNYDSFLKEQLGRRWLHWHIPYHVAQYSHHSLKRLAGFVGLDVSKFYTFTPIHLYLAQQQIRRGSVFSAHLLAKDNVRLGQRFLDMYLAPHHRTHKGDALFAELEVGAS